ncbi:MAG: hypothetical protein MHM6MM_006228 [Cercozoa sp. M6MM]
MFHHIRRAVATRVSSARTRLFSSGKNQVTPKEPKLCPEAFRVPEHALRPRGLATWAAIGFAGGALGAVVGLGGGVVMVPLMALAGLGRGAAQSSSIAAVLATGLGASVELASHGAWDPLAALCITITAMFSAQQGVRMMKKMDADKLKKIMALFTASGGALVGADVLYKRYQKTLSMEEEEEMAPATAIKHGYGDQWKWPVFYAGVGVCSGLLTGMLGVGGGVFITPVLSLFSPLPQVAVVGTTLAAMMPASAVALFTAYRAGTLLPQIGASLAAGSLAGSFVASKFALDMDEETLRIICACVLLSLAPLSAPSMFGLARFLPK